MRRHIVVAILAAFGIAAASSVAVAQHPFYQASQSEIAGPPGTLIRSEPMISPVGATTYRVLYRSRGLRNEPIAVSGVIVVPLGAPPPGGRPIVAWAHPTTGVVPHCAPSQALSLYLQIQGHSDMIARGYAIAATDYPGLGTPGPHPYLVGVSEGRAVLDSVRVTRALPGAGPGSRFAVWGHSQGGHAALYTGLLARSYAPELRLVGVAAAAPATELATLLNDDLRTIDGKNLAAISLYSWARVFGAPIQRVVDPAAMPTLNQLSQECIESTSDILDRDQTERPLRRRFLSVKNLSAIEPYRTLLARNTPGTLPPDIPVLIAQGLADTLVLPPVTKDYVTRLCRAGSRVKYLLMANIGHASAALTSAPVAVDWMAGRFAGRPAPSDCY
jgi:alpha-beta hydrolase superfamily lysophospholipase